MTKTETSEKFDVIVVGGGMVGLTFACAIAHLPLKIAVIENNQPDFDWPDKSIDSRVSALTRASQQILQALGVWQSMVDMRASPFRQMHVWDATGTGEIHFDAAEIGERNLGHIVENRVTHKALFDHANQLKNISFKYAQSQSLSFNRNIAAIELNDGHTYQSDLVVGADGAHSFVRDQLGIQIAQHDYGQTAIVSNVKTELDNAATAWQRFLPSGPLAFLPLLDGYSSIVWSTTHTQAEHLMKLDDQAFTDELQSAFNHKLGKILDVSPRKAFVLRSQHARRYVRPAAALIGDAAHTIHPLAGQGVNLGFADAACLAQIVAETLRQRRSIGSLTALRRYERWRKGDNLAMQTAMTGFKYLFSNNLPVVSQLRNLGLSITNRTTFIKNQIIRRAMGLSGDLPTLAIKPHN